MQRSVWISVESQWGVLTTIDIVWGVRHGAGNEKIIPIRVVGESGAFALCPGKWLSDMILLLSGDTGSVVRDRLNVEMLIEEEMLLDNPIIMDFETSATAPTSPTSPTYKFRFEINSVVLDGVQFLPV